MGVEKLKCVCVLILAALSVLGCVNYVDAAAFLSSGQRFWISPEVDVAVQNLTKSSLMSIQSPDGDIIDCVLRDKQPAFDHPALRNHIIQEVPSSTPHHSSEGNSTRMVSQCWHRKGIASCPDGTVPIRRPTLGLVVASSSQVQSNKRNRSLLEQELATRDFSQNIEMVKASYSTNQRIFGTKAVLSIWKPHVEFIPELSAVQLLMSAGSPLDSTLNTVEAGWMVSPRLFGDTSTRLFTYWTSDFYQNTGCYDLTCPGFVQVSKEIALGASVLQVSTVGGPHSDVTFSIWKDEKTQNWWLAYGSVNVGYWPHELFTKLTVTGASVASIIGEVVDAREGGVHTTTAMGSGHFPREGPGRAAYAHAFQVSTRLLPNHFTSVAPADISLLATSPSCYDIQLSPRPLFGSANTIILGGPARNPRCP